MTKTIDMPLPLQVWAVNDDYDYVKDPKYFSATGLLKPIKMLVLGLRAQNTQRDLNDCIPTALGSSIHASIENAWKYNYKTNLKKLGFPDKEIDKIRINPDKEEPDTYPVYIEQRTSKELDGYIIGGKYDMVLNGELNDFKSTSVYTYIYGSHDEDYKLQGSIYRWLNQDKIKEDWIAINFIFTDWSKQDALYKPDYPKSRCVQKKIPLLSIKETEQFIKKKLTDITKYKDSHEQDIPECTDEDLWRSATTYKYFSTLTSARATKNFNTHEEAMAYKASKGGKGVIRIVPGEVRRCKYCPAASICEQRKRYFND